LGEKQGSLRLLLFVQLTQRFSGGIISPILALFMRGQGLSVSQIGLLGTAGMIGWLIFEPLAGMVADRIRKKYMVAFGIAASSLVYLAYPYASGFWHFALLAFAMSSVMSFHAISVKALIAELLPLSGRGKAYGRFVSAISIGGIVAPLLGGYISEVYDQSIPFFISAGIGVVSLVAILLMRYDDGAERSEPSQSVSTGGGNLWTRPFISILIVRMLYLFNLVFRQHTLPIFLHENPRFGASETQIGLYMGVLQFTSALSQAFLGDLCDRVGSSRVIVSSLLLSGVSYIGMIYLSGPVLLVVLGALQGVFFAAADLSMMVHLMAIMPEGRTGMVMGLYSESENVGGMVAAPSLGVIYDSVGPHFSVLTVSLVLVFNAMLSYVLIKSFDSSNADR
jgi:DHA1 family multidrug resistance protein-like MFS transporter